MVKDADYMSNGWIGWQHHVNDVLQVCSYHLNIGQDQLNIVLIM